jgi:1,4-alpha-glucan branching enzyme
MKKIWLMLFLFCGWWPGSLTVSAQFDPEKIGRIEDGRLILTLNLHWSEKERQQLFVLFDLDSVLLAEVYSGKTAISVNGVNWTVKKISTGVAELSKPLETGSANEIGKTDLYNLMDQWMNFRGKITNSEEVYGVNSFRFDNAFVYSGTLARFYLPGFENAGKVYVAGSFNNWSTISTPLKFMGKGWMVDLKLNPGKYVYKFVVDGRWTTDPSNNLRERGDAGTFNSVVWCANHSFFLKGYPDAGRVVVTGNFYHWSPKGLAMKRISDGWTLPVWFRDGTYVYKFLVDNKWMTDPANPLTRVDADGNFNSFLEIGDSFLFTLNGFTDAEKVVLTGSFNNWDEGELVMQKTARGWQLPYVVPPGNYEYKFIADGHWMIDSLNPFTSGSGDTKNSFIALKANHVFELHDFPEANKVIVAGSFNGWNSEGYRMTYQGGRWIFPVFLKPGKYTYKFIVDGKWMTDPDNTLYEENQYGTGNSVLWIDPNHN